MTDYTELVEALRDIEKTMFALGTSPINMDNVSIRLAYDKRWGQTANDAADAIEALQAENPIVESVLLDKMRQRMEETVCHCNVKENAELIAKILDDDVDGKVFELPKRGDIVRCGECKYWMDIDNGRQKHGMCAQLMPNWFCADGERKVQE